MSCGDSLVSVWAMSTAQCSLWMILGTGGTVVGAFVASLRVAGVFVSIVDESKGVGAGLVLHPVQAYYTCILLSVAYVVCGDYE